MDEAEYADECRVEYIRHTLNEEVIAFFLNGRCLRRCICLHPRTAFCNRNHFVIFEVLPYSTDPIEIDREIDLMIDSTQ